MFFDFYEDEHCYLLEDQYMFGEDILFAPILEQGVRERKVYLPKGTWVNSNDRITYEGEQTISVKAEINQFIAFIKSGSEVLDIFG
jgi:alpha-D-xyloside xylohydrolase